MLLSESIAAVEVQWLVGPSASVGLAVWHACREDKETGKVWSSTTIDLAASWFAVVLIGGCFLAWVAVDGNRRGPGWVELSSLGIGAGLLFSAVKRMQAVLRYGDPTLHFDPCPGNVGAEVRGRLEIPVPYCEDSRASVMLRLERREESMSGDIGPRFVWSDLWRHQMNAQLSACETGTCIGFAFRLPDGVLTLAFASANELRWCIRLDARGPQIDLSQFYRFPVSGLNSMHGDRS